MKDQGYCEHHFSNFVYIYIFYKHIVKNRVGNVCGIHIDILYNEGGAHIDLRVTINILVPPQLTTVSYPEYVRSSIDRPINAHNTLQKQNCSFNKDLCHVSCTCVTMSILYSHVLHNHNISLSYGYSKAHNSCDDIICSI